MEYRSKMYSRSLRFSDGHVRLCSRLYKGLRGIREVHVEVDEGDAEERKEGPRRFFIAGDLNIESGFLCTNESEEKEEGDIQSAVLLWN